MSKRFSIGEIAEHIGHGDFLGGELVEIMALGPFETLDGVADYMIAYADDPLIFCCERHLRKRRPPEQPSAFTYQEILDMCNDKTIINPITEPEVREGLKGILQPFDNFFESDHGS